MDADFQEREFQLRQAAVLKECDLELIDTVCQSVEIS